MDAQNIDFGSIGDILGSLSAEDIENLKGAAQAMFSSADNSQKQTPPKQESSTEAGFDFSSFAKIASIMSIISSEQKDPRCDLLSALKPMLSGERQQKIDQAIKMIRLFAIIPKLKELS